MKVMQVMIMDEYNLKELNMKMGLAEYEMYQNIPLKETGSTNLCNGLPYDVFKTYLETQLARKYQNINEYDTPTTTYIMYVNDFPVGYICLRTKIDVQWKKWSGNFYYVIRISERKKGYGTKILELALDEFKKLGFKEVYGQSSAGNIASAKIIENNNGILLDEIDGTRYYKIDLQ